MSHQIQLTRPFHHTLPPRSHTPLPSSPPPTNVLSLPSEEPSFAPGVRALSAKLIFPPSLMSALLPPFSPELAFILSSAGGHCLNVPLINSHSDVRANQINGSGSRGWVTLAGEDTYTHTAMRIALGSLGCSRPTRKRLHKLSPPPSSQHHHQVEEGIASHNVLKI